MERTAEKAANILNFRGLSRIDFRVNDNQEHYVIDVSSTPHLTRNSSFTFVFSQHGLDYEHVLVAMLSAVGMPTDRSHSSDQNSSSDAKKPFP